MNIKKIICLLLTVISLLTFSGCEGGNNKTYKDTSNTDGSLSKKGMSLLYCRSDSFNPYTAVSKINRELSKLLFEPLVKTDNNFKTVLRLAKSTDIKDKTCKIALKSVSFSDGSKLTAQDVIYSYNLARASSTVYSHRLYEILTVVAQDSNTVVFTLTRKDPYFLNLIDFPIIKANSDKNINTDGVVAPPIGCGRYILSKDLTQLKLNNDFYGEKGKITEINLIDAPDPDSVSHYVEVGATGLYYTDLSDGNIVRMSGKKVDVNLNNFVYIGINSSYGELSGKYMRYAISSALNRKEICSNAYYNNATPATGFFNPVLKEANATQSLSLNADLEITIENLEKIGYNRVANDGSRVNSAGNRPHFTLLVNSENSSRVQAANLIAKQLSAAGIEIQVMAKSYSQYTAELSSGSFQLYLGEISVLPNMDISQLVLPGGTAAYGVGLELTTLNPDGTAAPSSAAICTAAINNFYEGNSHLSDVAGTLLTEMPQIPICYRRGILFYDSSITKGVKASQSDIYFSIEKYIRK